MRRSASAASSPPFPRSRSGLPARFDALTDILAATKTVPIDGEVGDLTREADRLLTEQKATDESIALLEKVSFYPDRLEYLHAQSFVSFFGEGDTEAACDAAGRTPTGDRRTVPRCTGRVRPFPG